MIFYHYTLLHKNHRKMEEGTKRYPADGNLSFIGDSLMSSYSDGDIQDMNDRFYKDFLRDESYVIYVANRIYIRVEAVVAVRLEALNGAAWEGRLLEAFPECFISEKREITIGEYRNETYGHPFGNINRVLERLNLRFEAGWMDPYPFKMEELIPDYGKLSRAKIRQRARTILGSKSLMEELDRIYSRENDKSYHGHPVHYLISAGDWGAARDIYEILLCALESNGRLLSPRQTILRGLERKAYRDERYRQVLEAAEGGVAVIEMDRIADSGNFATEFHEMTKRTGAIIENKKKDTLFIIIELTGRGNAPYDAMNNILTKADFIKITEGSGTRAQAERYLEDLAAKVDFRVEDPKEVLNFLPAQESYTVTDIYKAYNAWYGSGLKNHVYKAYKEQSTFRLQATDEDHGRPYEELQSMIGLTRVKTLIDRIIDTSKAIRVRERMGLKNEGNGLNMLFTGNPGTAKTSVARLLARILKDEDAVKTGAFIECGRQDLVGPFVGWTARIVEKKFREASGGVLFIDEAYSLVDDSNSFGAEAINTITQLMENYRNEVIVIFAGYPDKMKTFLDQNEGLRSRIAFHLDFPDYTEEELMEILELMVKQREYTLDPGAVEQCRTIFHRITGEENYGNGRYVRNVMEHAILAQSSRVIREAGTRELKKDEMCRLTGQDFDFDLPQANKTEFRMGFVG